MQSLARFSTTGVSLLQPLTSSIVKELEQVYYFFELHAIVTPPFGGFRLVK